MQTVRFLSASLQHYQEYLVLLADGDPYTITATRTMLQELKKVENNKMLKLSFFVFVSRIQPIVEWLYTHVCICLHLHSEVTTTPLSN